MDRKEDRCARHRTNKAISTPAPLQMAHSRSRSQNQARRLVLTDFQPYAACTRPSTSRTIRSAWQAIEAS